MSTFPYSIPSIACSAASQKSSRASIAGRSMYVLILCGSVGPIAQSVDNKPQPTGEFYKSAGGGVSALLLLTPPVPMRAGAGVRPAREPPLPQQLLWRGRSVVRRGQVVARCGVHPVVLFETNAFGIQKARNRSSP